jgi:hypothetical protein
MDGVITVRRVMVQQSSLKELSFQRIPWYIDAPEGSSWQDITTPLYFAAIAGSLKEGDRIEIVAYDRTWLADVFIVSSNGRNEAKGVILAKYLLSEIANPVESQQYAAKFNPRWKWHVIRLADREVIKKDMTEVEANDFIKKMEGLT